MKLRAGFAKHETTCFIPGIGMMGYGLPQNAVRAIGTPLFARAMFMQDERNNYFIWVHLEQAFVSMAIKTEVLKLLNQQMPEVHITEAHLLMTAQHTHSAPGGYTHYPMYNFTIGGFQQRVFDTVCSGIIKAIITAKKNISEVNIKWGKTHISEDKEVAFNRSMKAYVNNRDIKKIHESDWHLGVNRQMQGLFFYDHQGLERAHMNWFGVHATSISSDNHLIHHDNKGIAAHLYEKQRPQSIAFFLQEAAGDISPNFIWDKKLKRMRGKFQDQYESCELNGEIQFREAEKIIPQNEVAGIISSFHQFVDMSLKVAPAAHGVAFFEGTKEGPGISKQLGSVLKLAYRFIKTKNLIKNPKDYQAFYQAHDPKDIMLDQRDGNILGIPLHFWKKLPPLPDATIEAVRSHAKKGAIETLPWVPHILPFQIITIGPLLIAAVPGEITTIAAKRLKEAIEKSLKDSPIKHIIVSSYANAYMGYITTAEEYAIQCYEGGHNIYGSGTLKGVIEIFEELTDQYKNGKTKSQSILAPFEFPSKELAKRTVN